MNTKITFLAALLLGGASQAALAQDHDHADRSERPAAQGHAAAPAPAAPPPHAAPLAPPPPAPSPGGRWRSNVQPGPPAAPAGSPPGDRHGDRGGGDRDRSSFAPGGTAPGDRRWDRRDAPREVVPPTNGEHGWDREHDGHGPDARHDGHWDGRGDGHGDRDHWRDGDHRGPPPNWRHWERGQFPPSFFAPRRFRVGPYRPPYGWYVRSWGFGDFLPRGWYGPGFWIDDFYDYDLPWPPPGMHWVRVGDDVLLVDDYSGRIVQVIRDLFW